MNGYHHRDLSESLRLAVEQGHTERVVDLLKRGAPSELDDQGQTPLHIAASAGHVELVDVLIQAGFDVTVQDYVSTINDKCPRNSCITCPRNSCLAACAICMLERKNSRKQLSLSQTCQSERRVPNQFLSCFVPPAETFLRLTSSTISLT